ncbi:MULTISPECIES: nitroreductase family deazaflavin-dependent oxidoreductase [unclassified Crossiella]|uniref:nitroreductase family deazaflavin-dependent oxidoreductase n=1 Tax=unclassified Crossiella TaxID=2620835 RepID=UPI001FFECCF3|nr:MULTISPECIES: nitroreductase family deazaflavin-dependent oxidoreductase [unclassified Crossiella]MCK2244015.1 nitroreductase family deazaflavin-dependent oxidoreductase [Crossiella sp. S99.2]MCK2257127.1 nitroreductase family deazaflavin-dependent oxidoreductase [Crossiella sp. S99.1]
MSAEPIDSPTGWVREHIDRYVSSDGVQGHEWNGTTTLLLTTTGRRSGEPRRTALIYQRFGADYVVVAAQGGAPTHPAWYLNLQARPEVQVQVAGDRFTARARTADEAERARLWPVMTEAWPDYDQYQTRTSRRIPVVVLERV